MLGIATVTVHRFAAKRDRVERTLLQQLRGIPGLSVTQLSGKGVPDLLLGFQGHTLLVEVKSRKGARFTPDQLAFQETWTGRQVVRAQTIEDVLTALGILNDPERQPEPGVLVEMSPGTLREPERAEPGTRDDAPAAAPVVVRVMSKAEAEACVQDIRKGLENVFSRFADLYDREGWRALGYDSWRECIKREFGYEKSHAYRMLAAARVELALAPYGDAERRERHLRELAGLDNEAAQATLALAERSWVSAFPDMGRERMTALWVKAARVVVEEAVATEGLVDVGEDEQVPFEVGADRAVLRLATEYRRVQDQHIRAAQGDLLHLGTHVDLERAADAVRVLAKDYTEYKVLVYGKPGRSGQGKNGSA